MTRKSSRRAAGNRARRKPARRLQFPVAAQVPAAALPHFAKRQLWGLVTPRGLPVIYGDRSIAEEDRDHDERVALFEIVEVATSGTE